MKFRAVRLRLNPTTNAITNGMIVVDIKNGRPPYKISLNGATQQEDPLFTNLPPGSYKVEVIDANDCKASVYLILEFQL